MPKQLTGKDIINQINIGIHAPVMPNKSMKERLIEEIQKKIDKANIEFYTERGNTFDITVFNSDFQEKPEIQNHVIKLVFNFLFQNN